jgi:hypothetical protein
LPIAVHGACRDPKGGGGIVDGKTAVEAALDHARGTFGYGGEPFEAWLEVKDIHVGSIDECYGVIEGNRSIAAAAFSTSAAACVVDDDPSHRASSGGEEIRTSAGGNAAGVAESEIGLVYELCWREGKVTPLSAKTAAGHLAELVIDERQ